MKPIIFANWKCNPKTLAEAKALVEAIVAGAGEILNKVEIVICPPFPYIRDLVVCEYKIQDTKYKIHVGAQDCFWEAEGGPFTGTVSPAMLKDIGCEYVLLGHSERKRNFGEDEMLVNRKLKASLEVGLRPVLFFGELEPMPSESGQEEILRQLEILLKDIEVNFFDKTIFVYEPAFAISTSGGKKLTPAELKEKVVFIRNHFKEKFGKEIKLVFGGSVDKDNINDYLDSGTDGAVPGQASLKAESFLGIIKACVGKE